MIKDVLNFTVRRSITFSQPKRWIFPLLKPPLNCLLKGISFPNQLTAGHGRL